MSNDEMAKAIQRATGSLPWDECTGDARMFFREMARAVHSFLGAKKPLKKGAVATMVAAGNRMRQHMENGRDDDHFDSCDCSECKRVAAGKAWDAALRAAGGEV